MLVQENGSCRWGKVSIKNLPGNHSKLLPPPREGSNSAAGPKRSNSGIDRRQARTQFLVHCVIAGKEMAQECSASSLKCDLFPRVVTPLLCCSGTVSIPVKFENRPLIRKKRHRLIRCKCGYIVCNSEEVLFTTQLFILWKMNWQWIELGSIYHGKSSGTPPPPRRGGLKWNPREQLRGRPPLVPGLVGARCHSLESILHSVASFLFVSGQNPVAWCRKTQ